MNRATRNRQIGRIHGAARHLCPDRADYEDLLEALTGERSCADLSDRQVNHVLDWMYYLLGRRRAQPRSFSHSGGDAKSNLVRLCYALARQAPPGYEVSPLGSKAWQVRTCGRCAVAFEQLSARELSKLVEGVKAIYRRLGRRDTETFSQRPVGREKGLRGETPQGRPGDRRAGGRP